MFDPAALSHWAISSLTWLARTSLSAAGIAMIVLAVQFLFGRWLSPSWRYRLWAVLVIRLLLPALPSSPASLANLKIEDRASALWARWSQSAAPAPGPLSKPPGEAGSTDAPPGITVTIVKEPVALQPVAVLTTAAPPLPSRPSLLPPLVAGAWLLVALTLLLRLLISNLSLSRRLRSAESASAEVISLLGDCCAEMGVRRRPSVLVTPAVTVPAAAGVFKPCILVPPGLLQSLSRQEQRTILLHELAHVRRQDVAANWLLALLQIVHWFNPVLWLAFSRLRADRELARDAMVLWLSRQSDPRDYVRTLLKLTESLSSGTLPDFLTPTPQVAVGMYGGKNGLKRRLHMIARLPQSRRRFDWTGPALALVLVGALLTSAKSQTHDAPPSSPATQPTLPRELHAMKVPVLSETPVLGRLFTSQIDAPATRPADKQASIDELTHQARKLIDDGKYSEALDRVNGILKSDPKNDYGVGVRPLLEDKVQYARQKPFVQAREVWVGGADRSDPRQPQGPDEKPDEAQKKLLAQLDRTLPALTFDAVGFTDVIDFLRDVSGTNIFVNWKSLAAAKIDRNSPVSANLRNVKFSKALSVILESMGGDGKARLGYTVDQGVITISTQDDLARNVVVRVYDVRDLVTPVPDFTSTPDTAKQAPTTRPVTREVLVQSLTKLIMDTVNTDSWKDRGGNVGALRELEGQLIITQTPENHKEIVRLLEQLREQRSIQILIEMRFVSCDQKVMEDLIAQWNRSETPPAPVKDLPVQPGGRSDIGRKTDGIFLNDAQLSQFMKLIQGAPDSVITASPRVTIENGQRASLKVVAAREYLGGYTPTTKGDGEVRYEPVMRSADPGLLVDLLATVSSDHRFVTVSLHPQVTTLLGFERIPWPGSPKNVDLMVQEPRVKTSEIKTTLTIPDGGSALLSGLDDPNFRSEASSSTTTRPAASRGIYLLVRPTIIRSVPKQSEFPLFNPTTPK